MRKITLSNKKGAIELSIGTIVIVVIAMSMLIMGIILVRNIFSTTTDSVKQIDQGVKNQINKLFSDDDERVLVLYPDSGLIKLKQGENGDGFALAIRNSDPINSQTFSYTVSFESGSGSCPSSVAGNKVKLIAGQQGTGIALSASKNMENPAHVRFSVAPDSPTCLLRVKVLVTGGSTTTDFMDVQIIPK